MVPHIEESWERANAATFEANIQAHVFCEFARAVREANHPHIDDAIGPDDPGEGPDPNDQNQWPVPDHWTASISLLLEADEQTSLNPGVSFVSPIGTAASMHSYATTIGAQLQAQTLHTDTFSFRYDLDRLKKMNVGEFVGSCQKQPNSSLLSTGHALRISNWLHSALLMVHSDPDFGKVYKPDGGYKTNLLQYETKFVVISAGSVTPQWKLERLLTNQSAVTPPSIPFVSANRIRTHDLIITMGPTNAKSGKGGSSAGAFDNVTAANINAVNAVDIGNQISSALNNLRIGY